LEPVSLEICVFAASAATQCASDRKREDQQKA
jgi:hypothetical protein